MSQEQIDLLEALRREIEDRVRNKLVSVCVILQKMAKLEGLIKKAEEDIVALSDEILDKIDQDIEKIKLSIKMGDGKS